jgi:hypothetical protein
MNKWKIIFGILDLIPASFSASSIECMKCGKVAWEIEKKNIPKMGICNFPLPSGGHCPVERSQKYYKCPGNECCAIMVKNKEIRLGPKEGCGHDNRHIVLKLPQLPSLDTSSSSSALRSEVLPGGTRLYHFLDTNPPE